MEIHFWSWKSHGKSLLKESVICRCKGRVTRRNDGDKLAGKWHLKRSLENWGKKSCLSGGEGGSVGLAPALRTTILQCQHHKQSVNTAVVSPSVVELVLWESPSSVAFWRRTDSSFDGPITPCSEAGAEIRSLPLPWTRRCAAGSNRRSTEAHRSESTSERCWVSIAGVLDNRRPSWSTLCDGLKAGYSWGVVRRSWRLDSDRWTSCSSRLSVAKWSAIFGVIADRSSWMALVRCWMHSSSFEPATMLFHQQCSDNIQRKSHALRRRCC